MKGEWGEAIVRLTEFTATEHNREQRRDRANHTENMQKQGILKGLNDSQKRTTETGNSEEMEWLRKKSYRNREQ